MWKNLQNNYFLVATDKLEVFVTDYVAIWCTYFTEASLLACLKDSNDGLEMDQNALINAGKRMLTKPEDLKRICIEEEDNMLQVVLLTKGLPLKLELKLTKGSKELFFTKITQVLLRVVEDLECSERELKKELIKKDAEIEEYKCDGGEIALRHLKTIPFNEKEHMNRHGVYISHFGSSDVLETLVQKAVDVPEMIKVKQEPCEGTGNGTTVKTELQDTDAIMNNSSIETKHNLKEEPNSLPAELNALEANRDQPNVKTEADVKIKNVKMEVPNSLSTRRPLVSPNKRKRSKLNF